MATRLFLEVPNIDTLPFVDIPDNDLVFDGFNFFDPKSTEFICLVQGVIPSKTIEFKTPSIDLLTSQFFRLKVLNRVPVITAIFNPNLIIAEDPADGECICGITCQGTNLSYVKVIIDPNPVTP